MTLLDEEPQELPITQNELKLLSILENFHKSAACPSKGALRIAGGWVRDKLMGSTSNDLDIVLEDCTGKTYADAFQRWLNEEGIIRELNCKIIPANPDKSKHLETAMLTLMEFKTSLDFVNLRSETYCSDSRVPAMEFGTPLQDAERRDFTINALFYNVLAHEVEDFTGLGLADLKAKILRTPLDAAKTFHDDPLRLIRAIRFLAKLSDFEPHEDIIKAATDSTVLAALKTKVSVERIRAELAKMMEYGEPASRGFKLMYEWRLLAVILDDKPREAESLDSLKKRKRSYILPCPHDDDEAGPYTLGFSFQTLVSLVLRDIRASKRIDILTAEQSLAFWDPQKFYNVDNIGVVFFTCLLISKFGSECPDPDKKGIITHAEYTLVKMKSRGIAQAATVLYGCFEALFQLMERRNTITRSEATPLLRTKGMGRWMDIASVMAASFKLLVQAYQAAGSKVSSLSENWLVELAAHVPSVVLETRTVIRETLALEQVWNLTPLISGKTLPETLPKIPPGLAFREVMNFQTEWILEEWRNGIDQARVPDLEEALKANFPQYT